MMSKTRLQKLNEFRATLPAEDSELQICPPDCKVDHDAQYPNWMRGEMPEAPKQEVLPTKLVGVEVPGCKQLTVKSLMQHSRLYGKSNVLEIATLYGIEMPAAFEKMQEVPQRYARPSKPKAKRTPLRDQALALMEKGHPWVVIEDTLNLSRPASMRLKEELVAV